MTINLKLEQLYLLLDKAEDLVGKFTGRYSNHFFSAEEFHTALTECITKLKTGDTDQLDNLWLWFAPTRDWDDFTREDGQDLANKIFLLVSDLKNELNIVSIVDLIIGYQESVERVMNAFKQEYNRTDLLMACRRDKLYPPIGNLKKYRIKNYRFHGVGLCAQFDDNSFVDFDFSFLPEQRHDGFSQWRLSQFALCHPTRYKKYQNKNTLEQDFNKLIETGAIVQPPEPTSLYFFRSALAKREEPDIKKQKPWWKFWQID